MQTAYWGGGWVEGWPVCRFSAYAEASMEYVNRSCKVCTSYAILTVLPALSRPRKRILAFLCISPNTKLKTVNIT